MQTHTKTLKNGLNILLVDTEAIPSVTSMLLVGAGSRYENQKNNGVAHFFEHMAFKGSKKYPSAEKLATLIEGMGGIFNAFTSDDHTAYYVKAPAEEVPTVIDVLADMIQHPILDEKEIEKEKGVIVQEMNMYEDMPGRRVFEHFETLLYGDQPLGFDIIGTKESVTSFDRSTFTNYIDQLYHPENVVFVLAGGLTSNGRTLEDYEDLIEKACAQWKPGKAVQPLDTKEQQTKPALALHTRKSEQAHFVLGYRTFDRFDERKYTLNVLMSILGAGMSSRLFREVREKRGLCYTVRGYSEYYDDVGYCGVYAGVEPDIEKASEAIRVIRRELSDIMKNGVNADELKTAKELIKGRTLLSLEDTFNIATLYARRMLFYKDVMSIDEFIKKTEAVTAEDVKNLANQVFKQETLNLAVIGPFKDKKVFERLLT